MLGSPLPLFVIPLFGLCDCSKNSCSRYSTLVVVTIDAPWVLGRDRI